jgi:hypothetical protein
MARILLYWLGLQAAVLILDSVVPVVSFVLKQPELFISETNEREAP